MIGNYLAKSFNFLRSLIKTVLPFTRMISSSCNFLKLRERVSVIVPRYAAIVYLGIVSLTKGSAKFSVPAFLISTSK